MTGRSWSLLQKSLRILFHSCLLLKPEIDPLQSILALYKRRLLVTTEILLTAMARAAKIGWSCLNIAGKDVDGARMFRGHATLSN